MCSRHLLPSLSQDDCHTNWVSCVRFSPNAQNPVIVSCGWDKLVKVGRRRFTSGSPLLPFTLSPPHPLPSGSPLLPFTLSPPHPLPSGSPLLPFTPSPPHPLTPYHLGHPSSPSPPHPLTPYQQVWNLTNCKLKTNHFGHNGFLNCVTVSPDGSLCASGGKVSRQLVPRGGRTSSRALRYLMM